MIANTADRVAANTCPHVNERIRQKTEANIARCISRGDEAIDERLQELDQEWDIERYVETVAPILTLTGIGLGIRSDKRWLLLSTIVQGFFLQHAIQGWCPPIPILRNMGIRTSREIDAERIALKSYRGDLRRGTNRDLASARQAYAAAIG